jgi:hypothetical protein
MQMDMLLKNNKFFAIIMIGTQPVFYTLSKMACFPVFNYYSF